jgi:hypothetical protein
MGLKQGQTNNPGGRPAGSQNKKTEEIRQTLQEFISGNISTLQNDFDSLQPKDRLQLLERLLRYVVAPLSSTTITYEKEPENDTTSIKTAFLESLKKQN